MSINSWRGNPWFLNVSYSPENNWNSFGWTGQFWMAECTLGFTHRKSRLGWELGYNWFHSFRLFTVEVGCFYLGAPSCWHWFGWQVLLVGLHSMWSFQKQFFCHRIWFIHLGELGSNTSATRCSPWARQVKWIKLG
jgi:hypothetical protein